MKTKLLALLILLIIPISFANAVEVYGSLNGGVMFEKGQHSAFAVEGSMVIPSLRNETSYIYSDLNTGEQTTIATYEMVGIDVSVFNFAIGGGLWQTIKTDSGDETNAAMKLRISWKPFDGVFINGGAHYAPIPSGGDKVFPFLGVTISY